MLSVCDHRLSPVEKWAEARMELLRGMSGLEELNSYDFSDDKLGDLLIVFAAEDLWGKIETTVNSQGLSVYRFDVPQALNTFRLDAAPMQSYGSTKAEGLLQYGYHKHHGNLPQFKVKLCTLGNSQ